MASIQQNGSAVTGNYFSGTSTKNKGGSAVRIGSSSTVLSNQSSTTPNVGVFGSVVVDDSVTTNDYAAKAVSGGSFAYNTRTPVAMKSSVKVGDVNNTVLSGAANVPSLTKGINKLETLRTYRFGTAIRAGHWNIYTGKFTVAPTVAVDPFWDNAAGTTSSTSTDTAAGASRTAPGKLSYRTGAKIPVRANYSTKTG
jgi:hypothetical protein